MESAVVVWTAFSPVSVPAEEAKKCQGTSETGRNGTVNKSTLGPSACGKTTGRQSVAHCWAVSVQIFNSSDICRMKFPTTRLGGACGCKLTRFGFHSPLRWMINGHRCIPASVIIVINFVTKRRPSVPQLHRRQRVSILPVAAGPLLCWVVAWVVHQTPQFRVHSFIHHRED